MVQVPYSPKDPNSFDMNDAMQLLERRVNETRMAVNLDAMRRSTNIEDVRNIPEEQRDPTTRKTMQEDIEHERE